MAAIGKIREQSTLLLIVIGGAMVAFVLGDIFSNRGGSGQGDQYVGEVFGEEINFVDYEKRVEAEKQSMASIGQGASGSQDQQVRNQVWNDMVQEKVMYAEMNKIGLRLGQDEFDDIRFGENVREDFMGNQNFQDPQTGQFDPKLVQNYFSVIQTQYPLFYEAQVNRIVNERLYEKYNALVKNGEFVNVLEAKDEYYRQEQQVNFNYVAREFASVADSTVVISDDDLRTYYNKHKEEDRFDRDATANIKFVSFDVQPTEDDKEAIKEELSGLKNDFGKAKSDSLFVLKFSSSRNAAQIDLNGADNPELQEMIDNAENGDVIGPFQMGERFAIAKIKNKGTEERASARHILLSKQSEPDMKVLMARADSIKKVIQKNDNFEEMVTKFSEDPGSVQNGGKYEDFDRKMMVEEFTEAAFDKPVGSINIVETTYGVHIVEPLEHNDVNVVKALLVDEPIIPSNRTFNEAYDEANSFSIDAKDASGMVKLAEEKGYKVEEGNKITTQARTIPGIAGSVEAVRWAHNVEKTKVGQVSQPFEFDRKIVVVSLDNRTSSGRASFEDAKEDIKPDAIREKKVEMFKADMKDKSLDDLKADFNLDVKNAVNVSEKRPSLPGGANEGYIVGYALSMTEGDLSQPLEGNRGVYVIKLNSKTKVEPREDYTTYRDELLQNKQNGVKTYTIGVYRALKDFAKVKDERSRSF